MVVLLPLLLAGCGEKKQARVEVPPPPPIPPPRSETTTKPAAAPPEEPTQQPKAHPPEEKGTLEEGETLSVPADAKPIYSETGMASWYGEPYHNRLGSNGHIYNMHALTAAHRTLPLGAIVRVTNVRTGHTALVRITDRGPFIEGRILDLSLAAAKAVDVWLAGVAMVRMEVLATPAPVDQGGRWAVQIGAFEGEEAANQLADHLSHRYHTTKVLRFSSPTGDWWVRVRVKGDDRRRAEEIAHEARTPEGGIFLVRLD